MWVCDVLSLPGAHGLLSWWCPLSGRWTWKKQWWLMVEIGVNRYPLGCVSILILMVMLLKLFHFQILAPFHQPFFLYVCMVQLFLKALSSHPQNYLGIWWEAESPLPGDAVSYACAVCGFRPWHNPIRSVRWVLLNAEENRLQWKERAKSSASPYQHGPIDAPLGTSGNVIIWFLSCCVIWIIQKRLKERKGIFMCSRQSLGIWLCPPDLLRISFNAVSYFQITKSWTENWTSPLILFLFWI